jgi:hypothetical protein
MRLQQAASLAVFAALGCFILGPSSGCSSASNGNGTAAGNGDGGPGGSGDDGAPCTTLNCNNGEGNGDDSGVYTAVANTTCAAGTAFKCKQVNCSGGGTTTLTGQVFDPAGTIPLFNVAVYVPNMPPIDLPEGVACGNCGSWYTAPVVSTTTDESGNFTLTNMPVGMNIPLIVQVGKWRMTYTLSNVAMCQGNDAAKLAGTQLRLPRNHTEGHIPNIAISTGALDSLECLIRRIGIDASEYTGNPTTSPDGPRIHIFTGGTPNPSVQTEGAQTQNPTSKQSYQYLWNNETSMDQFDVVLLACEGNETAYLNDAGREVLQNYTNSGGRVFASHFHYSWFTPTGPFATVTPPLATWSPDGVPGKTVTVGPNMDNGFVIGDVIQTLPSGMPFPEGVSLHKWLGNVKALTNDKLQIWYARHNADLAATNKASQAWIQLDPSVTDAPNAAEYFSFDTPIGTAAGEQCGRVVYSDLHVSGGINAQNMPNVAPDYPGLPITPDGCAAHALTPQEKALEFMIFDLSSCLTPIGSPSKSPTPQ